MGRPFERVAVVNRGEAAMRFLNAAAEYRDEHDVPLRTIALFTEPDRRAWFVREADEAFCLGPATFLDERDGHRKHTYLDYETVGRALVETRAEAVWVGWGFVAEHADFADLCDRLGIVFIGPEGNKIRRLGDKVASKRLAEEADVPVLPWAGGPAPDVETARAQAEDLGYPLFIKAAAGGGGRGIRRVVGPGDIESAFEVASSEARHAFGDPTVFLERQVTGARHVEVQIIADAHGTVWPIGVRDCSLQRRNQKVLEESASTALDPEQEAWVRRAAARICTTAGYTNAGTVEFLFEPDDGSFHFMEVNTRLQVEHPVTEMTTGIDLVKLQIHVARGGRLEGDPPAASGHAIEVRLNAEDPENGFAPAPGKITYLRVPAGAGVRVETGVAQGDEIAPEFDSMIAKIVAHGHNRNEAIARLTRAVGQCSVVVEGGTTNKAFLYGLLQNPAIATGDYDTGWLDRLAATGDHLPRSHGDIALLQAAVEAYDVEGAVEQAQFYTSAARGRIEVRGEMGRRLEIRHRGHVYALHVYRLGVRRYRVVLDDRSIDVLVDRLGDYERRLTCGDRQYRTVSVVQGPVHLVEVEGVSHRLSREAGGVIRAPSPAVVVSIAVAPGDEVAAGDSLVVVESMKMETAVTAPYPGTVRSVLVAGGVQVDAGAPLLTLDVAEERTEEVGDRIRFDGQAHRPWQQGSQGDRCTHLFNALRSQVLGYDRDPADSRQLLTDRELLCSDLAVDDPALLQKESGILEIFSDICELSGREPEPDLEDQGLALSARENLFVYLRSPDRGRDEVPAAFLERLQRALAHYGVESLDRTPELEEALLWLYKSVSLARRQVPAILSILDRRLEAADELAPTADDAWRETLDRLVNATERRHPDVCDLAREVRYRDYDKPLLDRVRTLAYEEMEKVLSRLTADPDSPQRDTWIKQVVDCPYPMRPILMRWFDSTDRTVREIVLEVLTRRFYRIRTLEDVNSQTLGGRLLVTADYDYEGSRFHLVATFTTLDDISSAASLIATHVESVPDEIRPVADVYVLAPSSTADIEVDTLERQVRSQLESVEFTRPVHRIDVAVTIPVGDRHRTRYFTYRQTGDGFREELAYRDLHPMLGKRNDLWRLSNFESERVASGEDVHLFHGVAHDNPRDERLFALAEVRDLTPVRDENGQIISLPNLERVYLEALSAIRRYQSHLPPRKRLLWNRVILQVRPVWDVPPDRWHALASRLLPAAQGLGLQKTIVRTKMADPATGEVRDTVLHVSNEPGRGLVIRIDDPADKPIKPLSDYEQKVAQARRRGLVYPYELVSMLTPSRDAASRFPSGEFSEYDLEREDENRLVPAERPAGQNTANLVVGLIRNVTPKHPEGMTRVVVLGDPTRSLGSLAEAECRRIIGAFDLAEEMGVPLEWFAVSSGARISMTSGTENMDWIGDVLRRIILFTQAGCEVNVIVTGINVGAQPYWNAEATMLMHTKGILIMTPASAMVLTGKKALDFSGGVSAEDNFGIGGYQRVMGPNGQAQYWAQNLEDACEILFRHYDHTYVAPGERFPRRAGTEDPVDRDVRNYPIERVEGSDFTTVGDVFSEDRNAERKKPFDIRSVMRAVTDQDHEPLERWSGMRHAETAAVWDAHVGGIPVCMLGMESQTLPRHGFMPADGPLSWTSGTLFPQSSKKVARALNAATGNRPVVFLANLSGFDGSPESMRRLQLEFGAEIGRAVVNFDGPIVFCVISRYHGGAFVVFSRTLNESLEVVALEGSRASVIGGAPAAAAVFGHEVDVRTEADLRVSELRGGTAEADDADAKRSLRHLGDVRQDVRAEKLTEVADEFDGIHTVQRALEMGSVDRIVSGARLRPYIVDAIERGMGRALDEWEQHRGD